MARAVRSDGSARGRRTGRATSLRIRAGKRREDTSGRAGKERVILDAALDVFGKKGFSAARLEDVAAKAGVAKGTVYLYFASKEDLFRGLLRDSIALPVEAAAKATMSGERSAEARLRMLFGFMLREIVGTPRERLLRLIIAEGGRFPELAEFHHREVVTHGIAAIRAIAEQGVADGEFASDALTRFPQLAIAPVLMAVIWNGLFGRADPLDADALVEAHLAILVRGLKGEAA